MIPVALKLSLVLLVALAPDDGETFLRTIREKGMYPPETIRILEGSWDPVKGEDPILEGLRLIDDDVRKAFDAYDAGEDAAAKEAATALAGGDGNPYRKAYARLLLAKMRLEEGDAEGALPDLEDLWKSSLDQMTADHEVKFYIAFARSTLYERDEAIGEFMDFLDEFPEAPDRYLDLARQVLRDLITAETNPLMDVAGRMGEIKTLLDKAKTGDPTQEKQGEVVAILDEMIALMEEMEKQGSGGGNSSGKSGGRGPAKGNNRSSNPAQSSALPGGDPSPKALRRVSRGKKEEAWGELRGKEREEVLQTLKDKLPARYRELLEQYYKALAE